MQKTKGRICLFDFLNFYYCRLHTHLRFTTKVYLTFWISTIVDSKSLGLNLKRVYLTFWISTIVDWKGPREEITPVKVVICFQISIFVTAKTTHESTNTHDLQLWFAFKLVSLLRQKQLKASPPRWQWRKRLQCHRRTGNHHTYSGYCFLSRWIVRMQARPCALRWSKWTITALRRKSYAETQESTWHRWQSHSKKHQKIG